jgi:hypothetical protein
MKTPDGIIDTTLQALAKIVYTPLHAITVIQAQRDPVYRYEVEQGESTNTTYINFADMEKRWEHKNAAHEIEQKLSIAPRLEQWLERGIYATPVDATTRNIRWAWQRVTRGWDDRALWSLDHHVYKTLGQQLTEMADVAHGWPANSEWETFEDWQKTLRHHGEALTHASTALNVGDWEEDTKVMTEAQKSLQWVTKNIGCLWT